jgi:EAL domain-containing protein (putative c-di-GMP-specific phosphodiesterase class I)
LRDAGVHVIQGYLHARPMPEDALLTWLQNRK